MRGFRQPVTLASAYPRYIRTPLLGRKVPVSRKHFTQITAVQGLTS
jgi:hypothetical protein